MNTYKTIFAVLLATMFSASYAFPAPDRSSDAYKKAANFYNSLKNAGKKPSKAEWEKSLTRFKDVYSKYPRGSKTPEALYMSGLVNEELYKKHGSAKNKKSAVEYYRLLVRLFPESSLADDALFNSGGLNLSDKNVKEALSDFRGIVRWFPKSDSLPKAKEMIAKLDRAEKKTRPAAIAKIMPEPAAPEEPREADFQRVRYWASDDYARVVFDVSKRIHYKIQEGEADNRIVVDLLGVEGASGVDKKIVPPSGLIKSIEISSLNKEISRVMIELKAGGSYSTMELSDPDRIVVDINVDQEVGTVAAKTDAVASVPQPAMAPVPVMPTEPVVATPDIPVVLPEISKPSPTVESALSSPEPVAPEQKTASPVEKAEVNPKATESVVNEPVKKPVSPPTANAAVNIAVINPIDALPAVDPALVEAGLVNAEKPVTAEHVVSEFDTRRIKNVSLAPVRNYKVKTIVIDPGHGGKDPGAIGRQGLMEKDIVLDISLRLQKKLLKDCDCRVLMTRSKDVFIPLEERTAFANMANADLFISVHANSNLQRRVNGVETYFLSPARSKNESYVAAKENMLTTDTENEDTNDLAFILFDMQNTDKINESSQMASVIQDSLVTTMKTRYAVRDNGVKKAMFYVLHGARMPSILVETSFISNPKEEKLLANGDYRDIIAKGIAAGVENYSKRNQMAFLVNR